MQQLKEEGTDIEPHVLNQIFMRFQRDKLKADEEVLTAVINRNDAFQYCPQILEANIEPPTKFFGFQILLEFIKKRWFSVEPEQRDVIRQFLIEFHANFSAHQYPEYLTNIFCSCISQILVVEWPSPEDFFSVVYQIALENPGFHIFYLKIIYFFCQNVFETGENEVTSDRLSAITSAIFQVSSQTFIFLRDLIFSGYENNIVSDALKVIKFFVAWIPIELLIEDNFLNKVLEQLMQNSTFMVSSFDLLSAVFALRNIPQELIDITPNLFVAILDLISNYNLLDLPENEQVVLVSSLTSFQNKHPQMLKLIPDQIIRALSIVYSISETSQGDLFSACCDYWYQFSIGMMRINRDSLILTESAVVLSHLRRFLIQKMVKPDDLDLVDLNKPDKYLQKFMESTDLYKKMKTTLVVLTNNNSGDVLQAIDESIQLLSSNFSISLLNSICYSVCAISGVLQEETERMFLTKFLEILQGLISQQMDYTLKTNLSLSMMIIVSQYPRYFSNASHLFKSIIATLFEIMHANDPEIQIQAVHIFRAISGPCSKQFTLNRHGESHLFIQEIIQNFNSIVENLNQDEVIHFLGSVTRIIMKSSRQTDRELQLETLLEGINQQWDMLLSSIEPANSDLSFRILFVLRCNTEIVELASSIYDRQFSRLFQQLIEIYNQYASFLSGTLHGNHHVSHLRSLPVGNALQVKSSILKIFLFYLKKSSKPYIPYSEIIHSVFDVFINDFCTSHPDTRVPEVFDLLSGMLKGMKSEMTHLILDLFGTLFHEGMAMVKDDFLSFPLFRLPFFQFCDQLINYSAQIIEAPPEEFSIFVQTLLYGSSHPTLDVSKTSILAIQHLTSIVKSQLKNFLPTFYDSFYLMLIHHIFDVISDTVHKFAFDEQVDLLKLLLMEDTPYRDIDTMVNEIIPFFPMKHSQEIYFLLKTLISTTNDKNSFRTAMRDFLIQSNRYSANDEFLRIGENKDLMEENISSFRNIYQGPLQPIQDDEFTK